MAIIPLKQTVKIYKKSGLDEWGNPISLPPVTLRCRIDEGSYATNDQQAAQQGRVVVATARVLLDKLVDVSYDDELEYVDELGRTIRRKPLKINVKRDLGGKPLLTEVFL